MTGKTSAGRSATSQGTTEDATGAAAGPRGLRRLFAGTADRDRSSWRAGADPHPAARVTPRVWVALG